MANVLLANILLVNIPSPISISLVFVKHELKVVLKYIGVKTCHAPLQAVTDIAAKSNSMVGILWKTIDFKILVFDPFPGLRVKCYDKHLSLPMHINIM